ncbi:hypothetical protein, partial [uncultured Rikenella sp.]|uniref:hypothetical protein n=1 Tax=uncultured Rikenella sp. TaxID=368003 RepID=UPI0026278C50
MRVSRWGRLSARATLAGRRVSALFFSARLGKSSQNAQGHFADFPFKVWRAGSANLFSRPQEFHLGFAYRKTSE